jgi:hypothetical protein
VDLAPCRLVRVGLDAPRRRCELAKNLGGVYSFTWNATGKGRRTLAATASDSGGREARATRKVRVC